MVNGLTLVDERHAPEHDLFGGRGVGRLFGQGFKRFAPIEDFADPARRGDRAVQRNDERRQFQEFDQDLRQVVIERDEFTLRERPRVDLDGAGTEQDDHGEVHDHVGQGI